MFAVKARTPAEIPCHFRFAVVESAPIRPTSARSCHNEREKHEYPGNHRLRGRPGPVGPTLVRSRRHRRLLDRSGRRESRCNAAFRPNHARRLRIRRRGRMGRSDLLVELRLRRRIRRRRPLRPRRRRKRNLIRTGGRNPVLRRRHLRHHLRHRRRRDQRGGVAVLAGRRRRRSHVGRGYDRRGAPAGPRRGPLRNRTRRDPRRRRHLQPRERNPHLVEHEAPARPRGDDQVHGLRRPHPARQPLRRERIPTAATASAATW